jgi:hypothetical protein
LAVASSGGLEEAVDGDPYRAQWQAWRRPVPARSTAPELLQQCPAWRYRGRDGVPAGLTSWIDPAGSRGKGSRVQPAPLRGRGMLTVREWEAQCHGADTGHTAQSPIVVGMGSPYGVGGTAPGRDSQAHDGAAPLCQSIKCPYPRAGIGVRAREPRARRR